METIFVIILITIILLIGFRFFHKTAQEDTEQAIDEKLRFLTVQVAQSFTKSTLVACSQEGVVRYYCIDYQKAINLPALVAQNTDYFYSYYGNARIRLHTQGGELVLYDFHNPDQNTTRPVFVPVLVRYPNERIDQFGFVEVSVFS
ncbi:MAG: hypothetical protein H6502_02060 [Candidatus Woesearchaeota archaeon]|nr:MAG: hypothetical protein H6502_02060 [Candidatus Woesearchaeota archaeon]